MPAEDALLFIDANRYLYLYRTDKGKKLLAPLVEQSDYIFVTQQIVGEVQRNKIQVATYFLREKFKEVKLPGFGVPEHLSSSSASQGKDILQQMGDIREKMKGVNDAVDAWVLSIIEQISCSEDEVSKALAPIFAKAVLHSPEELQRARDRRELGNPPGKSNDPIGDQLTWEQILTHFKGKKRLWLISSDSDYGTTYSNKGFLNQFLYDELCKVVSAPEVYLFEDLVKGITHFVDTTGVKAEKRLTPEEVEEIEKEEKSLPYPTQLTEDLRRALAEAGKVPEDLRRALAGAGKIPEDLRRALAGAGKIPEDLRRALAEAGNVNQFSANPFQRLASSHQSPPQNHQSTRGDQEEKDEQPPTLPPSTQKCDNEDKKDEEGKAE
jgi:hypothetical protein